MTTKSLPLAVINVSTVFICSFFLIAIQSRLYLVSRARIEDEPRVPQFGRAAEACDMRKRQIKLTLAASIVVLVYLVCMLPMAGFVLYFNISKKEKEDDSLHRERPILIGLTMLNTLADPFIYGLGMVDTRRLIFNSLKKRKTAIVKLFTDPV